MSVRADGEQRGAISGDTIGGVTRGCLVMGIGALVVVAVAVAAAVLFGNFEKP